MPASGTSIPLVRYGEAVFGLPRGAGDRAVDAAAGVPGPEQAHYLRVKKVMRSLGKTGVEQLYSSEAAAAAVERWIEGRAAAPKAKGRAAAPKAKGAGPKARAQQGQNDVPPASPSTRRNYYTSLQMPCSNGRIGGASGKRVAALLRGAATKAACSRFSSRQVAHAADVRRWVQEKKATPRELKSLLPWADVLAAYRAKRARLEPRERLVADLYLMSPDNPPKRLDYGRVRVVAGRSKASEPEDPNYVLVDAGRGAVTLVLREYKTSKAFGRLEQRLPAPLAAAVLQSLREDRPPASTSAFRKYLVYSADPDTPVPDNPFGKLLSRTMRRITGVPIGASNLRKSYITHLKAAVAAGEEPPAALDRAAALMLHSRSMQAGYEKRNIGTRGRARGEARGKARGKARARRSAEE